VLPRPEEPFAGKIGLSYKDSEPVKPTLKIPATFGLENPPNILLVLIDDCGYGQMSTFGGGIPTPAMDRVAAAGLRYTHFHTTALCSPTRAALLTGRNHHSVGSGVIGEAGTGFPGYSGIIPASAATFAEVLREYGYCNAWFGKNHNVPDWETSLVGPFDRWASASTISTDSLAVTRISFTQRLSKIKNVSNRPKRTRTGRRTTSPPIPQTRRSA
jgi:arylsulfatase A-like enzyme